MKSLFDINRQRRIGSLALAVSALSVIAPVKASGPGWSLVPYAGLSQLGDQSPAVAGAAGIADGDVSVAIEAGFTGGLALRYGYTESGWTSEIGWEYRSNDSATTTADGAAFSAGNYASNTVYLNGRYALGEGPGLTPWVGAGLIWVQEVDLDLENDAGERSFSDSGSVGLQVLAGVDYDLSDTFYLTGELRYSSQTGLELEEEGGSGRVTGIDYQPLTLGLGIGYRF